MNSSIGQRLATLVLVAGVVGGFGSGIASCGRHARGHAEHANWTREGGCDKKTATAPAATTTPAATPTATPTPTPTPEAAPAAPTEPAPTAG